MWASVTPKAGGARPQGAGSERSCPSRPGGWPHAPDHQVLRSFWIEERRGRGGGGAAGGVGDEEAKGVEEWEEKRRRKGGRRKGEEEREREEEEGTEGSSAHP